MSTKDDLFPVEASKTEKEIMDYVLSRRLTMVSIDRLWAAISSARYIMQAGLKGDIVECGVWRGGCSLAMAMMMKTMKELGPPRQIFLFDTFAGMTAPTDLDVASSTQTPAMGEYLANSRGSHNAWCYSSLEEVKSNFSSAGCLDIATFVKGDVLETLENPYNLPASISVLRLDTDWYESTRKELEKLYPLLQINGILLIDDYGYWQGSRRAFDEYFSRPGRSFPLVWKTDGTGRGIVKTVN